MEHRAKQLHDAEPDCAAGVGDEDVLDTRDSD